MRKYIFLYYLQSGLFLTVVALLYACTTLHPSPVYNEEKRRLSDYENNYFIKIPSNYTLFQDGTPLAPALSEKMEVFDEQTFFFNKGQHIVMGMFRLKNQIDPLEWYALIDATKSNTPSPSNPLIENLVKQLELSTLNPIELTTHNNFLMIASHINQKETQNKFKLAVSPYATQKGGPKNSLFVAFIFYTPSVSEKEVQQDFEMLLENIELSYFLNYERSLDKTLTFH